MRKRKLLFALAIAFASLSFAFKANAQGTVPVWLNYNPGSWSTFYQTGFYVTLQDNNTNDIYFFETRGTHMIDASTYDLGDVAPGNYTVSVTLKTYYNQTNWYDWNAKGQYGMANLSTDYDTVLTNSIDLIDYMDTLELRISGF